MVQTGTGLGTRYKLTELFSGITDDNAMVKRSLAVRLVEKRFDLSAP